MDRVARAVYATKPADADLLQKVEVAERSDHDFRGCDGLNFYSAREAPRVVTQEINRRPAPRPTPRASTARRHAGPHQRTPFQPTRARQS